MRVYGNIRLVTDLAKLQEQAPEGVIAVGITDNATMFIKSSSGLERISGDRAKEILKLNDEQLAQFIQTRGRVVFEEPKPIKPDPAREDYLLEDKPFPIEAPQEESSEIRTVGLVQVLPIEPTVADETIHTEDDLPFDESEEEPMTEDDMWKRIEGMISELVDEKLGEAKQQIKDAVRSILDDTIDALARVRDSLE